MMLVFRSQVGVARALEFLIKERQVKAVGHETFDTDAGDTAAEHGWINENTISWSKISAK